MYLLDTNHCSHLIQAHSGLVRHLADLGEVTVLTCVVVQAELHFMAHRSGRVAENLALVERFLSGIDIYPIDEDTAIAYGHIKAAIFNRFGPKEKAKRRRVTTHGLGFSENDLWIAAVAKRFGLIVVSGDSDFARIGQVVSLPTENWLGPNGQSSNLA